MIEIRNVSKWYSSFQVLIDCTTSVKRSEVVTMCSPPGSGKSTLIRTVNALEPLQKGEAPIDGTSVGARGTSPPELRSRVGMAFQNFELFPHLSITEDLTIAQQKVLGHSKEEAMAKGLKYLDRMGLEAHAAKYPGRLSGGRQQRMAIARVLSMDPICMLFDEPISALDPKMINEVLGVIVELAKEGTTMICMTHEMSFARKATNRMISMDQGHIVEDYEKEEFFSNIDARFNRAKQFLSKILSH